MKSVRSRDERAASARDSRGDVSVEFGPAEAPHAVTTIANTARMMLFIRLLLANGLFSSSSVPGDRYGLTHRGSVQLLVQPALPCVRADRLGRARNVASPIPAPFSSRIRLDELTSRCKRQKAPSECP